MSNITSAYLPTDFGDFRIYSYPQEDLYHTHVLLVHEPLNVEGVVPVRIHSECLTGDVFSSKRCDCGYQLRKSMEYISEHGGMIIYLRQEGRGIGLHHKIEAYSLQDQGLDTIEANYQLGFAADQRTYEVAVHILKDWNVDRVSLLSNNPAKRSFLESSGIEVVRMLPLQKPTDEFNERYLNTKKDKLGHLLAGG